MSIQFPEQINKLVQGLQCSLDSIGCSNSAVYIYDNLVVKVQPTSVYSQQEATMLNFFQGKIPCAKLLRYESDGGTDYLAMSKVTGQMLIDKDYLSNPHRIYQAASQVLHKLWSLDTGSCPVDMSLSTKLKLAEYNVCHNMVDVNDCQPGTFGKNGRFASPEALLKWLVDNKPQEQLVVTHGDLCLPNVIVSNGVPTIIDVTMAGAADVYQDVALLYRSTRDNLMGHYDGVVYAPFDEKAFFATIGVPMDKDKLDYYIMMDELF